MGRHFKQWKHPLIEEGKLTQYNWMVQNVEGLVVHENTDIGAFTYINAKYGVTVFESVQIGSHCSIYSVSTIDNKKGPVIFEQNCSIGTHSSIMPGVTVGKNSIVGAHSLVLCDIPPNSVAVGIPAKVIKQL